jgi:glycosyltransferase involved in cell wall biosynthesis
MIRIPYTIAIATRNRLDALKLSIPRMLAQSRKPSQIIVVDSSDEHEPIRKLVDDLTQYSSIETIIIHEKKGLTRQRNKALEFVKHPVVFFPDDDSIWFENTAELQMQVYERDSQNQISAVCGAESPLPPSGFKPTTATYRMNTKDRIKLRCTRLMRWLESKVAPDPARIAGQSFYKNHTIPDWAQTEKVFPVEWMTGFRMSFRTSIIKKHRFDEVLSDYSLFEDIDASFSAWEDGVVVGVRNAKIFHYRSPENRDHGFRIGAIQILNKAYIIAKHTGPNSQARKSVRRHSLYKTISYNLTPRTSYSKAKAKRALAALKELNSLHSISQAMDSAQYIKSMGKLRPKA